MARHSRHRCHRPIPRVHTKPANSLSHNVTSITMTAQFHQRSKMIRSHRPLFSPAPYLNSTDTRIASYSNHRRSLRSDCSSRLGAAKRITHTHQQRQREKKGENSFLFSLPTLKPKSVGGWDSRFDASNLTFSIHLFGHGRNESERLGMDCPHCVRVRWRAVDSTSSCSHWTECKGMQWVASCQSPRRIIVIGPSWLGRARHSTTS